MVFESTISSGEPDFTHDIDVVVDLRPEQVEAFCAAFPKSEFYVSPIAAREAIEYHRMFNVIHPASGLKVDVIVPPDTELERSRRMRARMQRVGGGLEFRFSSPEDVILKKLEFYRQVARSIETRNKLPYGVAPRWDEAREGDAAGGARLLRLPRRLG